MIKLKTLLTEHESKSGKMFQEQVVYVTPDVINQGKKDVDPGCRCGKCIFFKTDSSECMLTTPTKCNAEHGVCALFLGKPDNKEIPGTPFKLIPKKSAGYIEDEENVPTRCYNCEYYSGEEKDEIGSCKIVDGKIYRDGCCNKWESGNES